MIHCQTAPTSRTALMSLCTQHKIFEDRPVLIAGPTASGKSALALAIAQEQGGVVVNADALQVFDGWRVLTARPSLEETTQAPHALYGHVPYAATYSVGAWLKDVAPYLTVQARPIIVGGTGLYFRALTEGLAEIPATPADIRAEADGMALSTLLAELDAHTRSGLDTDNRARVQRAWEVLKSTGRSIADWQADTPPPLLPLNACQPLVLNAEKDWLLDRITRRTGLMLEGGAIDEARALRDQFRPDLPSSKAIGAAELMAHLDGTLSLEETADRIIIATRQYAKRQRTWFRARMGDWQQIDATSL